MSDEEIQDFGEGGGTDAGWDEDEDGATMVAHVDSLGAAAPAAEDDPFADPGDPFGGDAPAEEAPAPADDIPAPPADAGPDPFADEGDPFAEEGDPFADEGDPFAAEGDPFADEGDPFGNDAAAAPAAESAPEASFDAPAEPKPKKKRKDKKKRKIDLKSRLSSVRAAGSMAGSATPTPSGGGDPLAFPPPPAGSVPPPQVLGGAVSGMPSPFAPEEPEKKPTAAQQVIKVDVGEEIVLERKKSTRKVLMAVLLTGVVAGASMFQLGKMRQTQEYGHKAVRGAQAFRKEIDTSNKAMADLSDALRKGIEDVQGDKYPATLADTLKKTNIPVPALQDKAIDGLPKEVLTPLLKYTSGVEDLNKQKDKLKNLLGIAKKPMEKYFAEKKKPVVNFAVVFGKKGTSMQAELVPITKPFGQKDKWPDKFKVLRLMGKKGKEVEVVRWAKGDLTGEKTPAIPVDERTVSRFTGGKLVFELKKALADTRATVDGRPSPNPANEITGLIKDGDKLIESLKKTVVGAR